MVDLTVKLPKHPWDDKEIKPVYGRTTGWKGPNGEAEIRYSDVEAPQKYSCQKHEATGSYEAMAADQKEKQNTTQLNVGNRFDYVADGSSSQTDGHTDTNVMSTVRRNSMGDTGDSSKKHYVVNTEGKVEVNVAGLAQFVVAASGSWSGCGTYGDQVNEHTGNWHEAFEKDCVQAVKGNKITMVEGGDAALHVQEGNYDCHVAKEGRIYTEKDLLIESGTKITLKVGGSTIVISAAEIRMVSPKIYLN